MLNNPVIKSLKNFYVYLFSWLILAVINSGLLFFGTNIGLKTSVADSLVFTLILCGFGLGWWYPARYVSLEQNNLTKVLLSHLAGAIISSTLWIALGYFVMVGLFGYGDKYEKFLFVTLPWRFIIGIMLYAVVSSFYYMVTYYTGFQERTIKEAELKNLVTVAELRSLKFQINPHFIFNSLNSMSALTEIDPKKAKEMIIKLADFLRYILATNEREKNKLSEELKNIRLYLEIEKIRFEDKFDYSEDIEEGCERIEIPNMILQPLFENVVKHAVYETLEKVEVKLICSIENEFLNITLQNSFDQVSTPKKGAGVGLKNIEERLRLIYHQENLMEMKREKGIFCVTLYIPVN